MLGAIRPLIFIFVAPAVCALADKHGKQQQVRITVAYTNESPCRSPSVRPTQHTALRLHTGLHAVNKTYNKPGPGLVRKAPQGVVGNILSTLRSLDTA